MCDAAREEAALEEEARQRARDVQATGEAAAENAAAEHRPFPDVEIVQVHRSRPQPDDSDTRQRPQFGRRRGPCR